MGQSATPIWNVQNPVRTFGPDGAARPGTVNSGPAVLDAVRLFRLRMDQPDLSKLRIDRSVAPVRRRRTRRWIILGVVALAVFGGAAWYAMQPRVAAVQTTAVVTTWPSQQFVVLNATGYVVAQRKAAISSKATGRLEWLGVAEGSRVKAGEVLARLDNRDVVAQAQSAESTVGAARASVDQSASDAGRTSDFSGC